MKLIRDCSDLWGFKKESTNWPQAHRQAFKDIGHSAFDGLPHTITLFFVLSATGPRVMDLQASHLLLKKYVLN